ncbi:hypothetical protein C8R44DRAFT_974165 [Mycena epipterygia]|nr:hypothetical protein C8R44DRAFT_974165 [Mycena epipterygia]
MQRSVYDSIRIQLHMHPRPLLHANPVSVLGANYIQLDPVPTVLVPRRQPHPRSCTISMQLLPSLSMYLLSVPGLDTTAFKQPASKLAQRLCSSIHNPTASRSTDCGAPSICSILDLISVSASASNREAPWRRALILVSSHRNVYDFLSLHPSTHPSSSTQNLPWPPYTLLI